MARPRDDEESPTFTGMVISPCSMYKEAGAGRVAADDVSPARSVVDCRTKIWFPRNVSGLDDVCTAHNLQCMHELAE